MNVVRHSIVIDYGPLYEGGDKVKVPCDIDGIMERAGNFLILECKSPGAQLSVGQRWMLEKLAREDNKTVLIVQIKGNKTSAGAVAFEPEAYLNLMCPEAGWIRTNISQFKDYIRGWEGCALANPGKHAWLPPLPDLPRYQP